MPGNRFPHNTRSATRGCRILAGAASRFATGSPWVHTNTGFLRFLHAVTNAVVWIGVSPPPQTVYPVERYLQAMGDAELAGARWIIDLDDDFRGRLLRHETQAGKDWERIARNLRYFEDHREWRDFQPFSYLAVVEDSDSGALLSGSLLDMLASQHTAVRVIPTRRLNSGMLRGVRVLLDIDPDSISASQNRAIGEFIRSGGAVANPPSQWRFPAVHDRQFLLTRQQADRLQDLWELAYNVTVRKNFGARTFNTSGMLSSGLAAPNGKSVLVHLLNYTDFAVESVTVHVLGNWKRARRYTPEESEQELQVYPVKDGTGVDIDRIPVLTTVRFEKDRR